MNEELRSLEKNGTWELSEMPPGRMAIGCKRAFKIKRKADGSIERYKARLVTKGYAQEGINYTETFAPVMKLSLRTLLAIGATQRMHIHQMDVKTAFLNGDLQKENYMQQPDGVAILGEEHLVCKLRSCYLGRNKPLENGTGRLIICYKLKAL